MDIQTKDLLVKIENDRKNLPNKILTEEEIKMLIIEVDKIDNVIFKI
jgi:hypothetical protein